MTARTYIESIGVRARLDTDPDLSYLTFVDSGDIERDRARLAEYGQSWHAIGIDAVAIVYVKGVRQELSSGGLWGVESDSDAPYLVEIAEEELDNLAAILLDLGFARTDIDKAIPADATPREYV